MKRIFIILLALVLALSSCSPASVEQNSGNTSSESSQSESTTEQEDIYAKKIAKKVFIYFQIVHRLGFLIRLALSVRENGAVGDAPLAVNSRMDSIIYLFLAAPPANSVLRHICYCSGIFCMHINHSGTLPNTIRLFIGYIVSYIVHFVNCAHL